MNFIHLHFVHFIFLPILKKINFFFFKREKNNQKKKLEGHKRKEIPFCTFFGQWKMCAWYFEDEGIGEELERDEEEEGGSFEGGVESVAHSKEESPNLKNSQDLKANIDTKRSPNDKGGTSIPAERKNPSRERCTEIFSQLLKKLTCFDLAPESGKVVLLDNRLSALSAFYILEENGKTPERKENKVFLATLEKFMFEMEIFKLTIFFFGRIARGAPLERGRDGLLRNDFYLGLH